MRIEIIPRTLTFRQPAGTSRGIYHVRRVWYVVAHDGTRTGIGECAPLHDLSADYTPDYEAVLRQCCDRVALTGEVDAPVDVVGALATRALGRAIADGARQAASAHGYPAARNL